MDNFIMEILKVYVREYGKMDYSKVKGFINSRGEM